MAILLVEQYFDFARDLAQTDRGDGSRRRSSWRAGARSSTRRMYDAGFPSDAGLQRARGELEVRLTARGGATVLDSCFRPAA